MDMTRKDRNKQKKKPGMAHLKKYLLNCYAGLPLFKTQLLIVCVGSSFKFYSYYQKYFQVLPNEPQVPKRFN